MEEYKIIQKEKQKRNMPSVNVAMSLNSGIIKCNKIRASKQNSFVC